MMILDSGLLFWATLYNNFFRHNFRGGFEPIKLPLTTALLLW